MATYGKAGTGVRKMWAKLILTSLGVLAGLWLASMLLLRNTSSLPPMVWLGAFTVILVLMRMILDRTEFRSGQMERGLRAEEAVEAVLATLGPRYEVIHDLVIGNGNIDHVVVGPAGIYTIETKSHKGKVTASEGRLLLNGRPPDKDFVSQSYAEAMAVKEYLKRISNGVEYYVRPLLVFSNAFVQVSGEVRGVRVLPLKWLAAEFATPQERVSDQERVRVGSALRPMATAPAATTVEPPRQRSQAEQALREVAARLVGVLVIIAFAWWLMAGGGMAWLGEFLVSGFADNVTSSTAPQTTPAAAPASSVEIAKQYLTEYAPDQYPAVANLDAPGVAPGPDGSTDYTWEWIDTSSPSAATVRTVTIRVDAAGEWAGLNFGE